MESSCNAGALFRIPGSGRSSEEVKGYPPVFRPGGIPWTTAHGVVKLDMTEAIFTFTFIIICSYQKIYSKNASLMEWLLNSQWTKEEINGKLEKVLKQMKRKMHNIAELMKCCKCSIKRKVLAVNAYIKKKNSILLYTSRN